MKNTTETLHDELDLIDLTVKKFTRPQLHLDSSVLFTRRVELGVDKAETLSRLGIDRSQLLSNEKFAQLLVDNGVPKNKLPLKASPTSGKSIYAFAKNDSGLRRLKESYGPAVAELVDARIKIKSTIEETRLGRLYSIGTVTGGPLPVPLLYYGAHPGRFSGRDKINLQNLGRGSALREAIVAPPRHRIIAADLSQIEARITAVLAKQWDLVDQFARDEDVYANFASDIYGYEVNADDHPDERFVGKTAILSLGYQSGGLKYYTTMNEVFNVPISEEKACEVVRIYRSRYKCIAALWWELNNRIANMMHGRESQLGPVAFKANKVELPNGMPIHYHSLRNSHGQYEYWNGKHFVKLYGGKLLENIVQALARIVMTTAELRLARHGLRAALSVHDELVFVVKEENVNLVSAVVKQVMEQVVEWMPELPVRCTVANGRNYGECK